MNGISGWLGTGAALITAGICFLLMRYTHHLPSTSHPWIHRAVIAAMYCAGAVLVVTTIGTWLLRALGAAGNVAGGTQPGSGLGWALATLGALFTLAAVVVAVIWVPTAEAAYIALGAPLVLALAPGGIAHQAYAATAGPAQSLVTHLATWAGG